uniref:Uncharacterized protein n=1 Tax=Arundo donax TaxID=35708 RepID=A0A0A9HJT9_ARUDO
MQYQKYFMKFE